MTQPSKLARKSLGAGPLSLTLIFAGSFVALLAAYVASDVAPIDQSFTASLVLAIVITVIAAQLIRRRHWKWLQRVAIPIDVESYIHALGTPADRARLSVHIGFVSTTPSANELMRNLDRDSSATVDDLTATIESPALRVNHPTTRGRYRTSHRSNRVLHAWFTRCIRTTLVPVHRAHPMHEIRVTLVQQ